MIKKLAPCALLPLTLLAAWPEISLDIEVGEALVQGSRAENVRLRLHNGGEDGQTWQLSLAAPAVHYQGATLLQPDAQALLVQDDNGWRLADLRVRGRFADSAWQLSVQEMQLARLMQAQEDWPADMRVSLREEQGALAAQFGGRHGKAHVRLSGKRLSAWLKAAGITLPEMQGMAISQVELARSGKRWQIRGDMRLEGGAWNSADGLYALDKAQGKLAFRADGQGSDWQGDFDLSLNGGEALISPLYFALGDNPLALSGKWRRSKNSLHLETLHFAERDAHGEGELALHWPSLAVQDVRIKRASGDADAIYRRYVQPFLAETLLADAELKGTVFAALHWRKGQWREWSAVLHHVDVVDKQERFALYGLDGQIGHDGLSRLRSRASQWRKLPVGGWEAVFRWTADGMHLLAPLRIPVLDGALVISRLEPVGRKDYRLDAHIETMDLLALSKALQLPEFEGEVSGEFRQIHFSRDGLRLQEPVFINIFNGRVAVNDLRIEQFFSPQPLLHFDLDIEHLDLRRLTRVMRVADIQGNISGKARDVQLANWKLKRFSADIHTSPDKPGKRSISHEAVQYLSQAGGGSAMVGEFVRILNAFPYEKLGFSASLAHNVLDMRGVEEAPNGGYYLVKGRGLPHLDIIGFERRVDWPELLRRLDAARNSDSAVIQ